jgi:RNA polymerase sigma-70 factor (ECF subfamily)
MLGSASEAEDVVQDAWLRWQGTTDEVREPAAYLATIVTRLSLTALNSARSRRETYVGPWLPEPVSTTDNPELLATHAESINLAVLLLLERLTAAERAAYVLHEAFDYPFRQIADVLETSEANARQLASRARVHLDRERGVTATTAERDRLLAAFLAAAQAGELATLEALLAEDVVSTSDGGGVVSAARVPVVGRDKVGRLVVGLLEKYYANITAVLVEANGEPAVLAVANGQPVVVWSFDFGPNGVRRMFAVLNPEKLHGFIDLALSHSGVPSSHSE